MDESVARVETNAQVYLIDHAAAEALERRGVIQRCLQCDPGGSEFHMDPGHLVAEVLDAGGRPWTPRHVSGQSKVAKIRSTIFNEHHGSNWA